MALSDVLRICLVLAVTSLASSINLDNDLGNVALTNGHEMVTWYRDPTQASHGRKRRHAVEGFDLRCLFTRDVSEENPTPNRIRMARRSVEEFETDKRACLTHERRRRQVMTGTLWCGNGDNAGNYTELGYFNNVDKCCRDHDHCDRYVVGEGTAYGVTNDTPYTWSDCKCDDKFRACLHEVDTYMAWLVGKVFFEVVTTSKCIEFSDNDPNVATAVNKGTYEARVQEETSWWNWFG